MVDRRDASVTRHVGGWIVLGAGLLLVCLRSALFTDRGNELLIRSPDTAANFNGLVGTTGTTAHRVEFAPIVSVGSRETPLESANTVQEPNPATALTFPQLQVELNSADQAELSCIEGVGPALAQRIINFRLSSGGFTSLQQLDEIPGVGPKLAAQLKAAVTINAPATPASRAGRSSNTAAPSNLTTSIAPVGKPIPNGQPVLIREHSEHSLDQPSHD